MRKLLTAAMLSVIGSVLCVSHPVHAKGSRSGSSGSKSYSSSPQQHSVSGYTRSNGTYVQPHSRSNPDGARNNNWTTQGNTNPHTGKDGTLPRSYYEAPKK